MARDYKNDRKRLTRRASESVTGMNLINPDSAMFLQSYPTPKCLTSLGFSFFYWHLKDTTTD